MKLLQNIILFFILFRNECFAKEFPQYVKIELLSAHDGDTIKANIHLPANIILSNEYVRFDYDAWEISSRTGQKITLKEKESGKKALQDLLDIFEETDIIYGEFFAKTNRDSFGRLLIKPTLKMKDGSVVDLRKYMEEKGNIR